MLLELGANAQQHIVDSLAWFRIGPELPSTVAALRGDVRLRHVDVARQGAQTDRMTRPGNKLYCFVCSARFFINSVISS
jgi:hypothetical protein